MSEVTRKAVSLTQAKTLYDDLRGRIENHTVDTATLAEIQLIIDNYGIDEEDEGMVVNATFGVDESGEYLSVFYKTDIDAADIAAAFKAGKNIVIHGAAGNTGGYNAPDVYFTLALYEPAQTFAGSEYDESFGLITNNNVYGNPNYAPDNVSGTHVGEDGKLYIDIYTD